ncbi:MAG TPA: hypothetical protein VMV03_11085 [Spirochaetia bacterium]|nr:hypothetical protein [Spirochaetia bacterium]
MAERIGDFFVRIGVMNPEQVDTVLALQKQGDRRTFGEIALSLGYADVNALKAFADAAGKG